MSTDRRIARALGALSLGLGAVQLASPRRFARTVGIERSPSLLVRAVGLREIGNGVALLALRRPVTALWARVAGDAMDLAVLGFSFRRGGRLATSGRSRSRLSTAAVAAAGITALDLAAGAAAARARDAVDDSPTLEHADRGGRVRVRKAVTIDRPVEDVYAFWRNLENLPRFMRHLESVRAIDDRRSVWRAWAPAGRVVEWEAEITDDRPNERLAWRSVEGSQVANDGVVTFSRATGDRGTVVTAELEYSPPGGILGARIARIFGQEPTQQLPEDLRRFKQVMETGEVLVSEATRTTTGLKQRAAQPEAQPGIREAAARVAVGASGPAVGAVLGGRNDTGRSAR
jgi:uncharacterized membrane protein